MNDEKTPNTERTPAVKRLGAATLLAKPVMKEHKFAQLTSGLMATSRKHGDSQQLRMHIAETLRDYIDLPS